MGLGQLYYTSCRTGLSGHPGYQFNAATPGVAPEVMREVETLTAYDPPRSLPAGTAPDAYPVNLCHVPGETTMVANVVFVGEDYSRRSGNYFVHALVTPDPARDLAGRPPIELWRSAGWVDRPVEDTDLPELPGPPPAGGLTPQGIAGFLAASGTDHHFGAMLTAADLAIGDGDRKVVIIAEDSDTVARWIAALSYALPAGAVRRMSFMTYSGQPRFSRAAVVGALPEVDIDRSTGFDRYYLFDLVADRATDLPVHPLARLLAHVGVAGCADLWTRVAGIDAGAGSTFAELYPLAVAAAGLPDGTDTVEVDPLSLLAWLERAGGQWEPPVLAAVGSAALTALRTGADLEPLTRLAAVADALDLPDLLDRSETVLVDAVLTDAGRADARPDGTTWPVLRGKAARGHAAAELSRRLPDLPTDAVLALLRWARRTGVTPDHGGLYRIGVEVVGPALLDGRVPAVAEAVESWLPVRAGAVTHVAGVSDGDAERVVGLLAGPAADLLALDDTDLDGRPALAEAVVLADARRGRTPPLDALREVADRRRADDRLPTVEAALLHRLWPGGRWTLDEAAAVTAWLGTGNADPVDRAVTDWLGAVVLDQPPLSDADAYDAHRDLCEALHRSDVYGDLNARTRGRIDSLRAADAAADGLIRTKSRSEFERRIADLRRRMSSGSAVFRQRVEDELIRGHRRIPVNLQALLVTTLSTYRRRLFAEQAGRPGDVDSAAFLWRVHHELRVLQSRTAIADLDPHLLPALRKWRKRDLRRLQDRLDRLQPGAAATFAQWCRTEDGSGLISRLARAVWFGGDGAGDGGGADGPPTPGSGPDGGPQ